MIFTEVALPKQKYVSVQRHSDGLHLHGSVQKFNTFMADLVLEEIINFVNELSKGQ